jgi:hypothetical protein
VFKASTPFKNAGRVTSSSFKPRPIFRMPVDQELLQLGDSIPSSQGNIFVGPQVSATPPSDTPPTASANLGGCLVKPLRRYSRRPQKVGTTRSKTCSKDSMPVAEPQVPVQETAQEAFINQISMSIGKLPPVPMINKRRKKATALGEAPRRSR